MAATRQLAFRDRLSGEMAVLERIAVAKWRP